MTLNEQRERAQVVIDPMAALAEKGRISPNQMSFISLLFAFMSAAIYYLSSQNPQLLYVAALMVLLNAAFDAVDGTLARKTGQAEPKGDFLDHIIDRYADMLILMGIILAGYVPFFWGLLAVIGVLLTSYVGTQAQALHMGRYYGGMMGRADRLSMIILATAINALYPEPIFKIQILGWTVMAVAIMSHITALQRVVYVWKRI